MDNIAISIYNLNNYAQRIANICGRISRLDGRLTSLYGMVGWTDLWNLIQSDALTCYSKKLGACKSYLEQTASDFDIFESSISNIPSSILKTSHSFKKNPILPNKYWTLEQKLVRIILNGAMGNGLIGFGEAEAAKKSFWDGTLEYDDDNTLLSASPQYGNYKNKKVKRIIEQDKKNVVDNLPNDDFYDNPKGTILDATVEKTIEHNVLDESLTGDAGFATGALNLKILHYEQFHSSASAGLYVFDKKGKKICSPSVSAEIGTSFAYIQVSADGRIGLGEDNNFWGLYGSIEAETLTAEVKGKLALNRKEIYVGLDAEVIAAEVSGSGGISVLGVDLGFTGGLKAGLGAHADFGFTDGKFKVDIGGAIGVGFDVGFEVDISGTVDTVIDFASSAWDETINTVSGVADGVGDFFNDVGDNIANFFGV